MKNVLNFEVALDFPNIDEKGVLEKTGMHIYVFEKKFSLEELLNELLSRSFDIDENGFADDHEPSDLQYLAEEMRRLADIVDLKIRSSIDKQKHN